MIDHCHCWICLRHSTAGFLCAFFQWTKDLSGTKHFLKVLWYCDPITLSHLLWEKSCSLIACFFLSLPSISQATPSKGKNPIVLIFFCPLSNCPTLFLQCRKLKARPCSSLSHQPVYILRSSPHFDTSLVLQSKTAVCSSTALGVHAELFVCF